MRKNCNAFSVTSSTGIEHAIAFRKYIERSNYMLEQTAKANPLFVRTNIIKKRIHRISPLTVPFIESNPELQNSQNSKIYSERCTLVIAILVRYSVNYSKQNLTACVCTLMLR